MIKVLKRPVIFDKETASLINSEFSHARWANHRFIDFEIKHQEELDRVTKSICPDLLRISLILSKLSRRKRCAERSIKKELGFHDKWSASLKKKRDELKKLRDQNPLWHAALKWDNDLISQKEFDDYVAKYGDFSYYESRRKEGETDNDFKIRSEKNLATKFVKENSEIGYRRLPTVSKYIDKF